MVFVSVWVLLLPFCCVYSKLYPFTQFISVWKLRWNSFCKLCYSSMKKSAMEWNILFLTYKTSWRLIVTCLWLSQSYNILFNVEFLVIPTSQIFLGQRVIICISQPIIHVLFGYINWKSPGRKMSLTDSLFSYFAACPKNQFHLQCKKREKTAEETFHVQYWDSVPTRYGKSVMVQWIHLDATGLIHFLLSSTSTLDST